MSEQDELNHNFNTRMANADLSLNRISITDNSKDALLRELVDDLKRALSALDRHDNAPYQCESSEGAESVSEARSHIEGGIRRAQAAMKENK